MAISVEEALAELEATGSPLAVAVRLYTDGVRHAGLGARVCPVSMWLTARTGKITWVTKRYITVIISNKPGAVQRMKHLDSGPNVEKFVSMYDVRVTRESIPELHRLTKGD